FRHINEPEIKSLSPRKTETPEYTIFIPLTKYPGWNFMCILRSLHSSHTKGAN
ncbi:hypothetical protein L9F63_025197, partial [Diploptera punctata]